jgi:hypothetical protein
MVIIFRKYSYFYCVFIALHQLFHFLVPKSCHYYQLKGAAISGSYVVDPDGHGKYPPFSTQCDFENDKNEGILFDIFFQK